MSAVPRLLAASAALALLLSPAAATAAPVQASGSGKAAVLKSLSILKIADLDFGGLVVSSAGTAVIDPVSGALTTTGTLVPIGTVHPATFTATGSRNSVVNIRVPASAITLTRVGGGGTMTVSNWTLDGKPNRKIPLNNAFNFSVGATLNVGAAQPDGIYTGTFAVTVQYP
jgi:hypothetical protein